MKSSVDYALGGQLHSKLFAFLTIGTSWMNDDYAEAFHSVMHSIPQREFFKARSGFCDIHGTLGTKYAFSRHIEGMLLLSGEHLVGEAAKSPLTKQAFQPEIVAILSYSF
jgi:outer membrane scaffolding protein for murein synthesis (MipA/OmpV family)